VGLSSVLSGLIDPAAAVQASTIDNLSILPCGTPPPQPAELLTSPHLEKCLQWYREQYDFVLIDSPALLAVSDPGIIAAFVDSVILMARLVKNSRSELLEAKQLLDELSIPVLGVVVNGVDTSPGIRRYESLRSYEGRNTDSVPAIVSNGNGKHVDADRHRGNVMDTNSHLCT
jgi:Mrp family chromosome partitioning ATPase